jgi:hypothetical protein
MSKIIYLCINFLGVLLGAMPVKSHSIFNMWTSNWQPYSKPVCIEAEGFPLIFFGPYLHPEASKRTVLALFDVLSRALHCCFQGLGTLVYKPFVSLSSAQFPIHGSPCFDYY